jgi:hypothetical protein
VAESIRPLSGGDLRCHGPDPEKGILASGPKRGLAVGNRPAFVSTTFIRCRDSRLLQSAFKRPKSTEGFRITARAAGWGPGGSEC